MRRSGGGQAADAIHGGGGLGRSRASRFRQGWEQCFLQNFRTIASRLSGEDELGRALRLGPRSEVVAVDVAISPAWTDFLHACTGRP